MDFEWDDAKSDENRRTRGFGFDVAARIFAGPVIEAPDDREDYGGEVRVQAIGEAEGRVLFVVYTDRGDVRRIISARKTEPRERKRWHARR